MRVAVQWLSLPEAEDYVKVMNPPPHRRRILNRRVQGKRGFVFTTLSSEVAGNRRLGFQGTAAWTRRGAGTPPVHRECDGTTRMHRACRNVIDAKYNRVGLSSSHPNKPPTSLSRLTFASLPACAELARQHQEGQVHTVSSHRQGEAEMPPFIIPSSATPRCP